MKKLKLKTRIHLLHSFSDAKVLLIDFDEVFTPFSCITSDAELTVFGIYFFNTKSIFFSKKFYGGHYTTSYSISTTLFKSIWS